MLLLLPPAGPSEACRQATVRPERLPDRRTPGTVIGLWGRELLGLAGIATWIGAMAWIVLGL